MQIFLSPIAQIIDRSCPAHGCTIFNCGDLYRLASGIETNEWFVHDTMT